MSEPTYDRYCPACRSLSSGNCGQHGTVTLTASAVLPELATYRIVLNVDKDRIRDLETALAAEKVRAEAAEQALRHEQNNHWICSDGQQRLIDEMNALLRRAEVAEAAVLALEQDEKVLAQAVTEFLQAIVEERGVNSHTWLYECAHDILAVLAAGSRPASAQPQET